MKNYKKLLLDDIKSELTDKDEYSTHVNYLIGKNKSKREYLVEGIKIFKILIDICIENGLVNDFIPHFVIYLKDARGIKNPNENIASIANLLKILDEETPPSVFMTQKVMSTGTYTSQEMRSFYFPKTAVEKLFNESFDKNIYMYYYFYKIGNEKIYERAISIEYNKHDVKKIKYHKSLELEIK
ncbi:MAG: hypothetical protein LBU10_00595 [Endomicrobium sp.]|jgi:hypothetical protein|nr:hypothetical protein [Endomicrobium sp.]